MNRKPKEIQNKPILSTVLKHPPVSFSLKICYTVFMKYSAIFEQSYHQICALPDFPREKTGQLWEALPRCSRWIVAFLYLLPFGEEPGKDEITYGKVLTLLTLSSLVHDDLTKERAFSSKEAVLYGDYFFALAFSLLPDSVTEKDGQRIAGRACRYSEKRLEHQKTPPVTAEESLQFAKTDYGTVLMDIAKEAMEKNHFNKEHTEQYGRCAEKLGTIWGLLCENNVSLCAPLLEEVKADITGLPMEAGLNDLRNELEGATLENKAQHRTAKK